MKTDSRVCAQCLKMKPVFRNRICVRCYHGNTTKKRFDKIVADFRAPSKYSRFLFDLWVEHRKSMRIEFQHIKPTLKLITALQRPVEPFRSWFDLYAFSHEVGIGKFGDRRGCPFILIGKLLEKRGLLERSPKCYSFFRGYLAFQQVDRSIIREYTETMLRKEYHLDTALKRLLMLAEFAKWTNAGVFLPASDKINGYVSAMAARTDALVFRENLTVLARFYEWCVRKSHCSANPFRSFDFTLYRRLCPRCEKVKVIPRPSTECRLCIVDRRMISYIESFRKELPGEPSYHHYLFDVYLRYIKRYRVTHTSWIESKSFLKLLMGREISPLLSWEHIDRESASYRSWFGKRVLKGCPFVKVGHVLEELGVIPIRHLDEATILERAIKRLSPHLEPVVREYVRQLRRRQRRATTAHQAVLKILFFEQWLMKNHPKADFFSIAEKSAADYLAQVRTGSRDSRHGGLRNFFRWCVFRGLSEKNPFLSIGRSKVLHELKICSPDQTMRLIRYIKSQAADPADELMIALCLFWGFGRRQLQHSRFRFEGGGMFQGFLQFCC